MEFIVDSVDKTFSIGEQLGALAMPGDIVCINGDLGAGKTHFTKGIAKGLNIEDYITSPTFNIVNEYTGRLKLHHFDVYRVNDPDEIYAIGFDEYIFSDAVSVIEWSHYISSIIPDEHIEVNIKKLLDMGPDYRKITITHTGKRYDYVKEIKI
ncbi:tRNA threonylcarbamoyladenosine biosynthesis protein TsaE [Clostridium acetobutylicum]|uniref:tRNA threonylcarbamoyladenosine biosynthesis protein TsaE n=1 Tax=Clostridium acetobutylicum (strain ATCC 824 / DSM 792 / JCM 1419 / IAM 19013 / LMG 5710 / NBRC 13948 / NRRL B-527 / VKM B-1787 / 2291 / W) TaxID=272562 RepID=Q97FA2_CLOAB|nr:MULTISPECIES: tRNA (adenosine(37)-N6)-threonylcarbamoyltransferase complex ATPase subunit type 1 TsaE [Clostridium]AAK80782.1 Predicted nucleotide-binding protein, YjeE family [Clostridium acetobutylicum ATCC 824]ADZ21883.1 nucleotide-binding protein, YjeE family [Clostridium acetobutylicum EA 2018]AEI33531.1 nucleotide-binding protein [Clostridium acetobutylicum DSM 1731]AWV78806.1 tRNA (adenosine(37)-N6)-threonylcarbamoyltransferase complex ATPase subunit type 1 TsaE [Clostridium acetobuty